MTGVLHAGQRVLDDEAVLEGVDDPVVVRPPSLAFVAARHRGEVFVARGVATEHVVPDHAVGRVDPVEFHDITVLVGVEEAVAEFADLALGHRHGVNRRCRRVACWRGELAGVDVFVDAGDLAVPALHHDARKQGAVAPPSCRAIVEGVLHHKPARECVYDAVAVGPAAVNGIARAPAPRDSLRAWRSGPVTLNQEGQIVTVEVGDRVHVSPLERVEEAVAESANFAVRHVGLRCIPRVSGSTGMPASPHAPPRGTASPQHAQRQVGGWPLGEQRTSADGARSKIGVA